MTTWRAGEVCIFSPAKLVNKFYSKKLFNLYFFWVVRIIGVSRFGVRTVVFRHVLQALQTASGKCKELFDVVNTTCCYILFLFGG